MDRETFNSVILAGLQQAELEASNTKGNEYSPRDDALSNFKQAAEALGLTPYQVLWIYMHKHWRAVTHFCRHGRVLSCETLASRIMDLRLYLALLLALAEDLGDDCAGG